jgi:hypothetical protein
VVSLRPPDWDWSFGTDGALALKALDPFATVPDMSPPVKNRRVQASRRRHLERERRLRRLAALIAIALVALVTLLLSAFGGSGSPTTVPAPASASRLVPAGPPHPEVVAKLDSLHLLLPVSQSRVTAIGFQGGSANALGVDPLGTQANQGLLRRLAHRIFGGAAGTRRWYQLPGGQGPATSALNVGAPAGTDAYAPVDGTVVAIEDVVMNDRILGSRIDVQPTGQPSLVVSISHVRVDPALNVGATVTAAGSKLGTIVDYSHTERQALARYTNDSGNHVVVEVRPSAALSLG